MSGVIFTEDLIQDYSSKVGKILGNYVLLTTKEFNEALDVPDKNPLRGSIIQQSKRMKDREKTKKIHKDRIKIMSNILCLEKDEDTGKYTPAISEGYFQHAIENLKDSIMIGLKEIDDMLY